MKKELEELFRKYKPPLFIDFLKSFKKPFWYHGNMDGLGLRITECDGNGNITFITDDWNMAICMVYINTLPQLLADYKRFLKLKAFI